MTRCYGQHKHLPVRLGITTCNPGWESSSQVGLALLFLLWSEMMIMMMQRKLHCSSRIEITARKVSSLPCRIKKLQQCFKLCQFSSNTCSSVVFSDFATKGFHSCSHRSLRIVSPVFGTASTDYVFRSFGDHIKLFPWPILISKPRVHLRMWSKFAEY